MKLLENIRTWKNKHFTDWFWDLLVGLVCAVIGISFMFIQKEWFILIIPFVITVANQVYNKLFEPKDFMLRMAIPILIFIILCRYQ